MTTPPVIVQPDLEAWVWANIRGLSPGITSFAYAANQVFPGWVYAHFIQVDARAKRKDAARALAEQARQVIYALADTPWPDGAVSYVEPVEGPMWVPDDDGLPRYVTRYEFRVHPNSAQAADITKAGEPARPTRRKAASPARSTA
jgi:hypothetical protein